MKNGKPFAGKFAKHRKKSLKIVSLEKNLALQARLTLIGKEWERQENKKNTLRAFSSRAKNVAKWSRLLYFETQHLKCQNLKFWSTYGMNSIWCV